MTSDREGIARAARRTDAGPLTELRVGYLSEMARLEPRLRLLPDVRDRTLHALPIWIEQEERVLLVAEAQAHDPEPGRLVGYATGLSTIWPPVLKSQHVGEVSEVYVLPAERGKGYGRALLARLTAALREMGAEVLRAPVPVRNEDSLERFRALGYRPLQRVLQKALEEG